MKLRILIKGSKYFLSFLFLMVSLLLTDGQQIPEREFDREAMDQYSEEGSFDYMNYTVKPPSIWERLSWWFQSMLERLFLNPNTPWISRIMYYLILLAVIGAALFYIVRLRYGGALTSDSSFYRSKIQGLERAGKQDFDPLITQALEEKNYKLAIRYVYLKTLMMLSGKELIKLKDWKSPYDYERELKAEIAPDYKELARLFEYVWYGDFEAGQGEFDKGKMLSEKLDKGA